MTGAEPGTTLPALRDAFLREFQASRRLADPEAAADMAASVAETFIARVRAEERQKCADLLREWVADRTAGESGYMVLALAQGVTEAAGFLDPSGGPAPPSEVHAVAQARRGRTQGREL